MTKLNVRIHKTLLEQNWTKKNSKNSDVNQNPRKRVVLLKKTSLVNDEF